MMDLMDYMNKVYFFAATMAVGYGASLATKKIFKMNIGMPASLESAVKTSAVLGACALGVDYAQENKWIPKDPFKAPVKSSR